MNYTTVLSGVVIHHADWIIVMLFNHRLRYDSKNKESQTEAEARDPEKAKEMRDPMNVTAAFPMPEGAHFCGPVAVEGSAPYKEMAPGTNAFDYTQAWLPDGYSQIFRLVCVWHFGLQYYGFATLRWRNPRKGRDQILPTGNHAPRSRRTSRSCTRWSGGSNCSSNSSSNNINSSRPQRPLRRPSRRSRTAPTTPTCIYR